MYPATAPPFQALVRRGLAFEEAGKLREALADMERARELPLPPSLAKVASQARGRLAANLAKDTALLAASDDGKTLVNQEQTLRLHFRSTAPTVVASGVAFEVSVHLANEFGCVAQLTRQDLRDGNSCEECSTDWKRLSAALTGRG
jgi:hypothetical protein